LSKYNCPQCDLQYVNISAATSIGEDDLLAGWRSPHRTSTEPRQTEEGQAYDTKSEKQIYRDRQTERETETKTETKTEGQRETERQRDRERWWGWGQNVELKSITAMVILGFLI